GCDGASRCGGGWSSAVPRQAGRGSAGRRRNALRRGAVLRSRATASARPMFRGPPVSRARRSLPRRSLPVRLAVDLLFSVGYSCAVRIYHCDPHCCSSQVTSLRLIVLVGIRGTNVQDSAL